MIAANDTELSNLLKKYPDVVVETLITKRGSGKGSIMILPNEYNSMPETVHLISSAYRCQLFI